MKPGSPEWYKARRFKLGGSEIASVLGLNPYQSRSDLYYVKIGLAGPQVITADMRRGLEFEDDIARRYATETSRKLTRVRQMRHPIHKWWAGTPDRAAVDEEGRTGIVEFKAPSARVFWRLERDGVPAMYITQCQWYLMQEQFKWCDLYLFCLDAMERILIRFEPEPEIQEWMAAEAEKFVECVRTKTHPDYEVAPMTIKPRHKPELKLVEGEDWQRAMGRLAEGRVALKGAQDFWDAAQGEAEVLMGEDILVQGYGGRISNPYVEGNLRLDETLLKTKHPDLDLDECRKQGKPHRQFRFTALNNKEK